MMVSWYNKVVYWFIPEKFNQQPNLFRKATFTVNLMLITGIVCMVNVPLYAWAGYTHGVVINILSVGSAFFAAFHFKYIGNFMMSAWMYMLAVLAMIWAVGNWAGGAFAPSTIFYSQSIIAAFWVGNTRLGLLWSGFLLLWIMGIVPYFESIYGIPENAFPIETQKYFTIGVNVEILIIFALMTLIYERGRTKLETKLNKSQQQLVESEKMASLGQLTAGIAHEINNPTNFVNGSSEALKANMEDLHPLLLKIRELKSVEDKTEILNAIEKIYQEIDGDVLLEEINGLIDGITEGGDRIYTIVKSLQNFSHESEDVILSADLEKGLDATLTIINHKILSKNIQVVKNYEGIPPVTCHAGKINQVFMNIIDNAIQAMDSGGKLTLETFQQNEFVKIKIQDNGKGMDTAIQKNIFNPFFTTKDVGEGTGLGLSISYSIVKDHGGNIEVKSEVGVGSEFTISLPLNL